MRMLSGALSRHRLVRGLLLAVLTANAVAPSTPAAASPSQQSHVAQVQRQGHQAGADRIELWLRDRLSAVLDAPTAVGSHDASPSTPWTAFTLGADVVAGTVALQATDLAIPSISLATSSTRTYNGSSGGRSGPLGAAWAWSYGMRISAGSGSVVVTREDGREDTFTDSGPTLTPPPGVYDQLTQRTDGTYLLTRTDQVTYTFGTDGRLLSIADPNGNTISVVYNGTAPAGLIDTAGRTWTVHTDHSGRIVQVRDPAGRTASFS